MASNVGMDKDAWHDLLSIVSPGAAVGGFEEVVGAWGDRADKYHAIAH